MDSAALARLAALGGLKILLQGIGPENRRLRLRVPNENCLPEIVRCLVECGAEVFSVIPQRVSLEDLFLQKMGPDTGL